MKYEENGELVKIIWLIVKFVRCVWFFRVSNGYLFKV